MIEFTLREYPKDEYEADMKKLLKEKGLHDAVAHFAYRINSLASVQNYGVHREVQECLSDILFLIDLDKENEDSYNNGLEDLWEVWQWYLNNDLETIRSIFPEHKSHESFMVMAKRVGLAESVRRIKEYMKADTGLLYSTISDLKADYTKEQIVKALKDNDIEVIEVNK